MFRDIIARKARFAKEAGQQNNYKQQDQRRNRQVDQVAAPEEGQDNYNQEDAEKLARRHPPVILVDRHPTRIGIVGGYWS